MAFTYFFRDLQTLELIIEHLNTFISGRSNIKIWDAGCAFGPEPYSLAILLSEKMGKFSFKNVKIYATDIDISNQFEDIIKNGIYPYNELQRIPTEILKKHFTNIGNEKFQISEDLRSKIIYKREDLTKLNPIGTELSLILCKNVLLHLSAKERVDVIKMFHTALSEGGLFATEHTQKMPEELTDYFTPMQTNAQIFKKITK
ncbi:MAG: chemotaxis protein CheR [Bacteroidetes bacterium GWE2_29_8]|nr:MAG: chemotaxis protein CheR [Bacteroidetes bacterium GWE2_29_8]OFY20080.1 MAG: chemotaxis protein CheR [Bacteroidetes bacterium GWF2_29_10]